MGIISEILKSLFSNKKRKKHKFHVSGHNDDDEEWSAEGEDSDSGDYGGDDGGDSGGDGGGDGGD
jgi:hypothetical protein